MIIKINNMETRVKYISDIQNILKEDNVININIDLLKLINLEKDIIKGTEVEFIFNFTIINNQLYDFKDKDKYIEKIILMLSSLPGYIEICKNISEEYPLWFLKNLASAFNFYNILIHSFEVKCEYSSLTTEDIKKLDEVYENCYRLLNIDLGQNLDFDVPKLTINYIDLNDIINGTYSLKKSNQG